VVQEETKVPVLSLLQIIARNATLTRRQACQLGGLFGVTFSSVCQFRATPVLAKSRNTLDEEAVMNLPAPTLDGHVSVEKAIKQRRTVRSFSSEPITLAQLSQILWAAQGITDDRGLKRAAPSGGALYPIDVYTVAGQDGVQGLAQGVYRYDPHRHAMEKVVGTDARQAVAVAALRQMWMATAPVILVLTAEYRRITVKYGERGKRYAMIEVGHIGQNIFVQCEALGLAAGIVGAFHDNEVTSAVNAQKNHEPLIIMPVGWKR
jgi:SagB-type dehydrogenase family enzyme